MSRFANDRVERSEFVWSALGGLSNTGDDSPLAGDTRLRLIAAAMRKASGSPMMPLWLRNCAIE